MRRTDREITDANQIDEIIQSCDCVRVGLTEGKSVYIVPLNFAYLREAKNGIFYLHCANDGRKLDLLRINPAVGFELDTNHAVNRAETACGFSFRYQSVIGTASAEFVNTLEEKKEALRRIVWHYSGKADWVFTEAQAQAVTVLKLTVTEMACKEHR